MITVNFTVFNCKDYGTGKEGFLKALEADMVVFPNLDTVGYSAMYNVQNGMNAVADMYASSSDIEMGSWDAENKTYASLDDMDEACNHKDICSYGSWDDIASGHAAGLAYRKREDFVESGEEDPTEIRFVCYKYNQYCKEYDAERFQIMYDIEAKDGAISPIDVSVHDLTAENLKMFLAVDKGAMNSVGTPDSLVYGFVSDGTFIEVHTAIAANFTDIRDLFKMPVPVCSQDVSPTVKCKQDYDYQLKYFTITHADCDLTNITDISHVSGMDISCNEVGYREMYKRAVANLSNPRRAMLWSDYDPEEANTIVYIVIGRDDKEMHVCSNDNELNRWLRDEHECRFFEIAIEDNAL